MGEFWILNNVFARQCWLFNSLFWKCILVLVLDSSKGIELKLNHSLSRAFGKKSLSCYTYIDMQRRGLKGKHVFFWCAEVIFTLTILPAQWEDSVECSKAPLRIRAEYFIQTVSEEPPTQMKHSRLETHPVVKKM